MSLRTKTEYLRTKTESQNSDDLSKNMENVNENKIPDDSKFLLSFLQELHKEKNDVPEMIKKKKKFQQKMFQSKRK